ncbi:hypothetical protein [Candidatus Hodgkinia cicadicola]
MVTNVKIDITIRLIRTYRNVIDKPTLKPTKKRVYIIIIHW